VKPLDLELPADLDDIREEWTLLAEETKNIFSTWDWNFISWRHFGSGRTPLAIACRSRDGRVVAVLPFYVWRDQPLRIVRLIGHQVGDQLGPICRQGDRATVAEAIVEALYLYKADIFVAEHLPVEEGWSGLLGGQVLTSDASPTLHFNGGSWEDFLASCSPNLRSQVRSRERRLMRNHEVCYRMTTNHRELHKDLDILFALHSARWGGERTTFMRYESFHREFAVRAFDRGWLRLWLLEIDGQPRAAWYGFQFAGIESFYQGGRDPAWDANSVGFVILAHSIRQALEDGMSEYRFLRGGESYKYRFSNSDRDVETMAITHGLAPRVALGAARVGRKSGILTHAIYS
jgi:CelD/BcsL family acetyltransferase involved in cellulose biosynthesis